MGELDKQLSDLRAKYEAKITEITNSYKSKGQQNYMSDSRLGQGYQKGTTSMTAVTVERENGFESIQKEFAENDDMPGMSSSIASEVIVYTGSQKNPVLRSGRTVVHEKVTTGHSSEIVALREQLAKSESERRALIDSHRASIATMKMDLEKVQKQAEDDLWEAGREMAKITKRHQLELTKHNTELEKLRMLLLTKDEQILDVRNRLTVVESERTTMINNHNSTLEKHRLQYSQLMEKYKRETVELRTQLGEKGRSISEHQEYNMRSDNSVSVSSNKVQVTTVKTTSTTNDSYKMELNDRIAKLQNE